MEGSTIAKKDAAGHQKKSRDGKPLWWLVFDVAPKVDATGRKQRRQKWVTFAGTEPQARKKLNRLVLSVDDGEFVEATKTTLLDWLRTWLKTTEQTLRPRTGRMYRSIIEKHIAPSVAGATPLAKLRASHLEHLYGEWKANKPATIASRHACIRAALQIAVRDRLVLHNVATDKIKRPKVLGGGAKDECWTALEARRFLDEGKKAGPQAAAFFSLALNTGVRKSELAAVTWDRLDLDAARLTIDRQLDGASKKDGSPIFGPTKTQRPRVVTLDAETVAVIRAHKSSQAALKLKNRQHYVDYGLVFAREHGDLQTQGAKLGQPMSPNRLPRKVFEDVIEAARVKRIVFHGCRHTCATLALGAGVPVHVVSARLGHTNPAMTLRVYAHALPDAQADAAERIGALLHG